MKIKKQYIILIIIIVVIATTLGVWTVVKGDKVEKTNANEQVIDKDKIDDETLDGEIIKDDETPIDIVPDSDDSNNTPDDPTTDGDNETPVSNPSNSNDEAVLIPSINEKIELVDHTVINKVEEDGYVYTIVEEGTSSYILRIKNENLEKKLLINIDQEYELSNSSIHIIDKDSINLVLYTEDEIVMYEVNFSNSTIKLSESSFVTLFDTSGVKEHIDDVLKPVILVEKIVDEKIYQLFKATIEEQVPIGDEKEKTSSNILYGVMYDGETTTLIRAAGRFEDGDELYIYNNINTINTMKIDTLENDVLTITSINPKSTIQFNFRTLSFKIISMD